MIKKFLLPLMLIVSTSTATELYKTHTYANGAINIEVDYQQDEDRYARDLTKDWLGIYKKGASSAWGNQIVWSWIPNGLNWKRTFKDMRDARLVKPGEYVVRLFKNNSFTVDKSIGFTIKKVDSFLTDIKKSHGLPILLSGFAQRNLIPNEKDWVGVYKKGDDNTWGNVIEWSWAREIKRHRVFELDKNLYKKGIEYQARYFLNNSYDTFKETEPFYMGEAPDHGKEVLDVFDIFERQGVKGIEIQVSDKKYITSEKDWVGVFNDNVENKSLDNLIAWVYVSRAHITKLKIIKPELLNKGNTYQAVFFKNNSYVQFGKKRIFKY